MTMNNDSTGKDITDQPTKPAQQHHTPPPGRDGIIGGHPVPAMSTEDALSSREESVTAREEVSSSREDTADHRDEVAQVREQAVQVREKVASSREEIIQEAVVLKAALENHVDKLRQANEHLVITTVHAQTMNEEIRKAKDQMGHMAHHDFLTDLPNRILLGEKLVQAIALAKRHGTKLAVLFIDLDRFKTINDSLGHAIGDTLLQSVAQRLKASVRSTDTVSRQGGDEFVVLLSEVTDEKAAAAFADKICKAVTAPYAIAEQDLRIGVTIGISMYPDDGDDAETLILNADIAMYHAKNSGRGSYHFFKSAMNARAVERQQTEGDLHRALEQQEFELYFQAQVALQTGSIIGAEALIRWRHPVRGMLLPAAFVPIAEECGAIVPIGRWVLREACRQTQAWLDAGLALEAVAVNISALEFEKRDFFDNLCAVLRDTRLAPQHLELELTETVLMENAESTMAMLQALKSLGVKIAVDDFGTGYSSLSYLKQFPVDALKIDQSFVAGIASHGGDDILVDSVISLGKSLGHRVIAEGIETREQLAFLRSHQCTEGQGYYLGLPMAAGEFSAVLKTGMPADLFPRPAPLH
jgi:diguanylate cyclase (GGDEF)-like protein